MATETEKLKRRLKFMNKELALYQHKLKRHAQKKEVKLADKKAECTQTSSNYMAGITDNFSSHILEPSVGVNNCNINFLRKYDKDFLSNLRDHHLNCTADSQDNAQHVTLPDTYSTHIASKLEVTQDNVSLETHVTFPAVIRELASPQDLPIFKEDSSLFKQSHSSKVNLEPTMGADCIEVFTSSTPKKLFTKENNRDLSPILMQKNCITKSSAKPQTKFLTKRMKGLASLTKSKRRDSLKQIPLTLNHDMLRKLKNSLHVDGQTHPNDTTNSENTTDTDVDITLLVKEDTVYMEPERNAFVTFPSCTVEGQVLAAFFDDSFLVLVQKLQITFWSFVKRTEPRWLHVGLLPRQHFGGGISVGCLGSSVNIGSEKMFVCVELWTYNEEQQTTLMCVIYSYNTVKARFKFCCLELKHVHGYIKNIKFCILPDLSVVVSWAHNDAGIGTTVTKFSLDIESQLILKSTMLTPVTGTVNSLHFLKGCRAVIIGGSTSQIFLWNHCTSALVKIIQCPRNDAKLLWADEDQGFLFVADTTLTHVELIAVNLTMGKWKQVRKFLLPVTYKLTGISVECGKMMAIFLEGFMCWDLKSGLLVAETVAIQKNKEIVLGPLETVGTVHVNMHKKTQ